MNNKKKIALTVVAVICVALLATLYFWNSDREKRYSYSEKNSVAMGTIISQKIYGDNSAKHIEKITALINGLDNEISWRNENSAVAELNREKTVTSASVASIIEKCLDVSKSCDGVFDITVAPVVKLWSIGEEGERIPSDEEIKKAMTYVDYKAIQISGNTVTLGDGVEIDLGAVGKGAACDNVMTYLKASDIKGAVISVGGSIAAYGDYNKKGDKWKIAVKYTDKDFLGVLSLDEGFVSTSGDYERYFEEDGKRYHHIIDATKGYPAESDLSSVTVICDSGLLSDALSTACFILGYEKSLPLLEKYSASAIFAYHSGESSIVGDIEFEYY